MDNFALLICTGFLDGTLGTLIGAGGGFILVPILIFPHPEISPEVITTISMAIVGTNAISGSLAYARLRRIDYKAGLLFAAFTIPGSILGVYTNANKHRYFIFYAHNDYFTFNIYPIPMCV